jgi:hypothetical protein
MSIPPHLAPVFNSLYQTKGSSDYGAFVDLVNGYSQRGEISSSDAEDILETYPNPNPVTAPLWDDEEGVEAYLKDPPDPGPLAECVPIRNWVSEIEDDLKSGPDAMKRLLMIDDEAVVMDIQENTLRILDGCNDPRKDGEWGERNHQGLVYGMVQSGKTASMISLVKQAQKAGYRLFVIFSGDKSSLRDQTQDRFSKAFNLDNGINQDKKIYSPTWDSDFKHTGRGYMENFREYKRVGGEDWTILIVMKKRTEHLNHLIEQVKSLEYNMQKRRESMAKELPAMIIDDEADYASRNTEVASGGDSTIHDDIVSLREAIPRNCYVAYTATPQACLSASPHDPIGYPRDFWWLLEPFMDNLEGKYVPRSYVGAWQVFHEESEYVLHRMSDDEWPHHRKSKRGAEGIWVPPLNENTVGHIQDGGLYDHEEVFLSEIERGARDPPPTIQDALMDFMITCGIRWWRNWRPKFVDEKPSKDEIERSGDYKHHAMMVHMSLIRDNQEAVRRLIARVWPSAVDAFRAFDPETSPDDDPFRNRWRLQRERTSRFLRTDNLPFDQICYFIERCIEITRVPIKDHRMLPYALYSGKPWIYLLNSTDEGMELKYSRRDDREIQTKKAAIVVGGNILSRGLTIEGLSVTVFCRTQENSMGDTNLQMGRWFGHKRKDIDLLCIHMQDGSREMYRQIAEADRYLRLQIKIGLKMGHPPLRVLVELRNSPWFRATSNSKQAFLRDTRGSGFAGKTASLREPDFDQDKIIFNQKRLNKFLESNKSSRAHNRAHLIEDVDVEHVIKLLNGFKCKKGAMSATFKVYAEYLEDWLQMARDGDAPYPPSVNVAVFNPARRKRAQKITNFPQSEIQAKEEAARRFESFYGGVSDDKKYKGDAHIDKSRKWHLAAPDGQTKVRSSGESILLSFYQLNPNYIRKSFYDWDLRSEDNPHGEKVIGDIILEPDDDDYIFGEYHMICFYAWTPVNGPMYGVGVNSMIDHEKVLQIGTEQVNQGE